MNSVKTNNIMAKRKSLDFVGILSNLTKTLARNDVGDDLRHAICATPREWDRFLDFQMESIRTVNVIETVNNKVIGVTSFLDSIKGDKAAEARFKVLHKEHNDPEGTTDVPATTDEEYAAMIKDGVYDDECGYRLTITHSVTHSIPA